MMNEYITTRWLECYKLKLGVYIEITQLEVNFYFIRLLHLLESKGASNLIIEY